MKQIENLLRSSIGLHAATIGSGLVEHTIRSRMSRLGLGGFDDYVELLKKSPGEWNNFVETIVVKETWFFREKHPFTALVRLAMNEWLAAHPTGELRLLSAACATGEEPYSMAMALLDAGFPAGRFRIDAVDISSRALAFAQRGVYGRNSFRGGDLEFRNRHFLSGRGGFILNPSVRKLVRFQRGNILSPDCLEGAGIYDFVFCRHLLIYFDRPTQMETLAKLKRLLVPDGVLFTGAAELPLALERGFVPLNVPRSFACRKSAERKDVPAQRGAGAELRIEQAASAPSAACEMPVERGMRPVRLERARELAGQGQWSEAAEVCEVCLRENGVSSDAFFVMGLARDALGAGAEAGEFYRKAVYLEPDHVDALRHWALWSERNGLAEQANRLRQRLERRGNNAELWKI